MILVKTSQMAHLALPHTPRVMVVVSIPMTLEASKYISCDELL